MKCMGPNRWNERNWESTHYVFEQGMHELFQGKMDRSTLSFGAPHSLLLG